MQWWRTSVIKGENVRTKRFNINTAELLETISPQDRRETFQEVLGGKFRYRLRPEYERARQHCRDLRDNRRSLHDPP